MTGKITQEIRDPIHNSIRMDDTEREIIRSEAFQRLRHVHQLALTCMVYPGAAHRRFEHSLGVMELAGKIFDKITAPDSGSDFADNFRKQLQNAGYWKRIVRLAALCHDLGHLPFSHAAEDQLLPKGKKHEHITAALTEHYIKPIIEGASPPVHWEDVAKIAVGQKIWRQYVKGSSDLPASEGILSEWELILSEIITGDAFGADRMDYLLRDAHHTGVAYGVFDIHRLMDTLKVLPLRGEDEAKRYQLGMEIGGLHAAEGLLLARYFMYTQVYFHRVRRIYNHHLQQCMLEQYPDGAFPAEPQAFVGITDNEIMTAIRAGDSAHAEAINRRRHYKCVYQGDSLAASEIKAGIEAQFPGVCHVDSYKEDLKKKSEGLIFPVETRDGKVKKSSDCWKIVQNMPAIDFGYVFAAPGKEREVKNCLAGMPKSGSGHFLL